MPEIWFPNLGIEIAHLDRVAFTVFGRNVYWYGIFIGLAVVLGVLMAMKYALMADTHLAASNLAVPRYVR